MVILIRRYFMILLLFSVMILPRIGHTADFFETLYDVPVLLDLQELTEQRMTFDKPSGRIASTEAISSFPENEILKAYQAALPQMGWKKIGSHKFIREKEVLSISIAKSTSSARQGSIVEFSLRPAEN